MNKGKIMKYIEYDNHTQTDEMSVEVNPVKFEEENTVGFYICRSRGYDKSIMMTTEEAEKFIEELQGRIESKRKETA